jgi:hypothetical protein
MKSPVENTRSRTDSLARYCGKVPRKAFPRVATEHAASRRNKFGCITRPASSVLRRDRDSIRKMRPQSNSWILLVKAGHNPRRAVRPRSLAALMRAISSGISEL